MHHLVEDHQVVTRLYELRILVVPTGHHGRTGVVPEEAAFRRIAILGAVCGSAKTIAVGLDPLLGFRGQRWNAAVRRVDDERRALIGADSTVPGSYQNWL